MTCQNRSVTQLSVLPDGVMPTVVCSQSTYIYYREDGDLYFYDAAIATEFNLFHMTCRTSTTLGVIDTYKLYFGITTETITDINIETYLTKIPYSNTAVTGTITATIAAPKSNTIYVIIPTAKDFTITESGFNIRNSFTQSTQITIASVVYRIYKTASTKTYTINSSFIITLV